MYKTSAALIMKNEEENLPRLLKSIVGKFDEIVVVDTGSTDRSIEIAKEFGCKVYKKEWNGFADARNYAISKCKGEWIWHFDADFELEEKEFEKFQKVVDFLKDDTIAALFVKVKNYGLDGNVKGVSSQAFIHRKRDDIYWKGNVHEELITPTGAYDFNIYVNHYGYQKSGMQKEKALRNLKLIYKDLEIYKKEKRKYFIKLFYLFQTLEILSEFDRKYLDGIDEYIVEYEQMAKSLLHTEDLLFFRCYGFLYLANIMLKRHDYEKSRIYIDKVLKCQPVFPDIFIIEAHYWEVRRNEERMYESYEKFLDWVEKYERDHFTKNGKMVIVDYYHKVDSVIFKLAEGAKRNDRLRESCQKKWRDERLRYFALVLLQLYRMDGSDKEFEKLAAKLRKRFGYDPKVLQFLTLIYFEQNKEMAFRLAKRLHELNPLNYVANKILAYEAFQANDCERTIYYLVRVITVNGNKEAIGQLLEVLTRCGYEEEAQNLKKRLEN